MRLTRLFSLLVISGLTAGNGVQAATTASQAKVQLAAAPFAPDSGSVAVRCGHLIDGVSAAARGAVTVLILNGRVAAVGQDVSVPQGTPELDLGTYTCLPGLIDMHTHLATGRNETADLSVYYRRTLEPSRSPSGARTRAATLLAGFTSVRDVGTYIAWADRELRDEINAGSTVGPAHAGRRFLPDDPGRRRRPRDPGSCRSGDSSRRCAWAWRAAPAEFRRKAEAAVAGGADVLKIIASGAVLAFGGVPGEPEMTPDEIEAVVDVAHAAGRQGGGACARRTVDQGRDPRGRRHDRARLADRRCGHRARARARRRAFDGRLQRRLHRHRGPRGRAGPRSSCARTSRPPRRSGRLLRARIAAGVDIVFGTDAAVYPHGLNARQFPIMVERGMTPMEAIQAATSVAARYMGWERSCRQRAGRPVWRSDRGARRSARGHQAVAGRPGRDQGRPDFQTGPVGTCR